MGLTPTDIYAQEMNKRDLKQCTKKMVVHNYNPGRLRQEDQMFKVSFGL